MIYTGSKGQAESLLSGDAAPPAVDAFFCIIIVHLTVFVKMWMDWEYDLCAYMCTLHFF